MLIRSLVAAFAAGLCLAFTTPIAQAAEISAVDFSYLGYMRAGTGVNLKGGKQACFNNWGSVGNEFRLGNECSIYGESSLRANLLKSPGKDDPFFYSQLTLAYNPAGDSQYEDTDLDADKRDINVVEAFVEGGNVDGFRATYWAGKRFYRSVDVGMNDFFYFSSMSGTGGGISHIDTGYGLFSAALLHESDLVNTSAPAVISTSRNDTSIGVMGKTALDLRLEGLRLTDNDFLYIWGAAAYTPPGYSPTVNRSYETGRGYAGGVRYRRTLNNNGFNDFAVLYGSGVMQTLAMQGAAAVDGAGVNNAYSLRLVENLTWNLTPKFASMFAATYEDRSSGVATDAKSTWWNVGIRPIYMFTEHFHLLAELGHSEVRDESDRTTGGARIGARSLNRITLAPEVGMKSGLFGRPVIRLFVAHSFWNDDNRAFAAAGAGGATKGAADSLVAFASETQGTSVGFQSEVWF